jgi:predicted ester cyclase
MDVQEPISVADATYLVRRALFALAAGDTEALELFTEDVIGDGPVLHVRSRLELGYQLLDRMGALSNIEFDLDRVEIEPDSGAVLASWRVAGDHTGEVMFNEDLYFAPTGRHIRMCMTTRLMFRQHRIAEFRTSYHGADLLDQIADSPLDPN